MTDSSDRRRGQGPDDAAARTVEQLRGGLADLSWRLDHINQVTEEDFVSVGGSLEDLSHHFRRTLEGAKKVLSERSGRGADNILIKLGNIMKGFEGAPRDRDSDGEDISAAVRDIFTSLKEFVQGVGDALREISRDTASLDMLIKDMVVAVQFQDITRQAVDGCVEAVVSLQEAMDRSAGRGAVGPGDDFRDLCLQLARTSFAEWERLVLVRHQLNDAKMTIRMSMELAGDLLNTVIEKIRELVTLGGGAVQKAEILRRISKEVVVVRSSPEMKRSREMEDLQRLLRSTVQDLRLLDNSIEDAQRVVTGRISGPMGRIESRWEEVDRELKDMAGELKKIHGLALREGGVDAVASARMTRPAAESGSQPGSVELF